MRRVGFFGSVSGVWAPLVTGDFGRRAVGAALALGVAMGGTAVGAMTDAEGGALTTMADGAVGVISGTTASVARAVSSDAEIAAADGAAGFER